MSKPTLYLMLGYPGAGKTTAAKAIHELTNAVHLWADYERRQKFETPSYSHKENLELYDELNKRVETLLREGKSVIFDTNFNFYKDRQKMRQLAAAHNANCVLVWLQTSKDISHERATTLDTSHQTRVLGHMPPEAFNRMASNLEPPHEDETYVALDGTKITTEYVKQELKLYE